MMKKQKKQNQAMESLERFQDRGGSMLKKLIIGRKKKKLEKILDQNGTPKRVKESFLRAYKAQQLAKAGG
jgi:microcompartment protein CcmL/EutN